MNIFFSKLAAFVVKPRHERPALLTYEALGRFSTIDRNIVCASGFVGDVKASAYLSYHGRVADWLTRTFKITAITFGRHILVASRMVVRDDRGGKMSIPSGSSHTKRRMSGNMSRQDFLDFYSPIYADTGAPFEGNDCGVAKLEWLLTWQLRRNVMRAKPRPLLWTGLIGQSASWKLKRLISPGRVSQTP